MKIETLVWKLRLTLQLFKSFNRERDYIILIKIPNYQDPCLAWLWLLWLLGRRGPGQRRWEPGFRPGMETDQSRDSALMKSLIKLLFSVSQPPTSTADAR